MSASGPLGAQPWDGGARRGAGGGRAVSSGAKRSGAGERACFAFALREGRPGPAAGAAPPAARPRAGSVRDLFPSGGGSGRRCGTKGSRCFIAPDPGHRGWKGHWQGESRGCGGAPGRPVRRRVRGAPAAAEVLTHTPVCPSSRAQLPKAFERFIQPSQTWVSALPHGRGRGRKSTANRELKVTKIVRGWWETAVATPSTSCLG